MAEETKISWAHSTLNFWIGCTRVSPACGDETGGGCYAEREWADRKKRVQWGPHGDRSPTKTWPQATKWNRDAERFAAEHDGERRRVFVNSLSDFFDNHRSIDPAWRAAAWQIFRECTELDFLLLTKRPQNIAEMLPADWGKGYPNVWLGTTVENQVEANRRIPVLLSVPAPVHFLSMEPLLGPVDLTKVSTFRFRGAEVLNALTGRLEGMFGDYCPTRVPPVDLIFVGGESGPGAREFRDEWALDLLRQCRPAGTAFHMKQRSQREHPRTFKDFDSFPAELQVREMVQRQAARAAA